MIKNIYYRFYSFFDTAFAVLISGVIIYSDKLFNFLAVPSDELLYTLIASFVSLLGFVMAFTAIIFSLEKSAKLEKFQESRQYPNVMDIYVKAIKWLGLITLVLTGLTLSNFELPALVIKSAVIFAFVVSTFKISRCIWITKELFKLSAA